MRLAGRRIGIVGGSIGGLTAAIALAGRGARVVVYERSRYDRSGVALLRWSNGTRALASLGVAGELIAAARPIARTLVRDRRGAPLAELPIGEWSSEPTVAVRRSELIAALARHVAAGTIRD